MKKNIVIFILVIIILAVVAGLLFIFIGKKPLKIINMPLVNKVEVTPQNVIIGNWAKLTDLLTQEKIPTLNVSDMYQFLSFCEFKKSNDTLDSQCKKIHDYYLGESRINPICARSFGYLADLNLIKAGNKDKFLQMCYEYYNALRQDPYMTENYYSRYLDCNLLWENKMYEDKEFCDIKEGDLDKCPVLLYDDEISGCANKINVNVNPSDLKSSRCQEEMALRKANRKSDCLAIDDTMTKLLCLDVFDNNFCQEVKDSADNLKFKDFVEKYQLKDCCY
jgi:hypothetical protein